MVAIHSRVMKPILDGKKIAVDTETTGLNTWKGDRPYLVGFCNGNGDKESVEFPVDPYTRQVKTNRKGIRRIRSILSNRTIKKLFWNAKFDVRQLESIDVETRGKVEEVMFAAHTCNSTAYDFKLKNHARRHIDIDIEDVDRLHKATIACRRIGKKHDWALHAEVLADMWMPAAVALHFPGLLEDRYPDLAELCDIYCGMDVERTYLLAEFYWQWMEHDGLLPVYEREMTLWPVIYQMETDGVRVLMKNAKAVEKRCIEVIRKARKKIEDRLGTFDKKPTEAQKRTFLFGTVKHGGLALAPLSYTPKKHYPQADKYALEYYKDKHPLIQTIRDFDVHSKALGTYVSAYRRLAVKRRKVWIIHCNLRQCGALTGRLSCADPNLTNVPKRAPKGTVMQLIRGAFGPRPGYVWYCMDYKQVEARVFAEAAGEEDLLFLFAHNRDPYNELVDRILNISGVLVDRQPAKNNFLGKLYGESDRALARAFGLSGEDGKAVCHALDTAFPRVAPYMSKMKAEAQHNGHVFTLLGRRINIPYDAAYKAVNAVIQGTAADILKRAMVNLSAFLIASGRDARMLLPVHDEIIVEVRKGQNDKKFIKRMADVMADNGGILKRVDTPVDVERAVRQWNEKSAVQL